MPNVGKDDSTLVDGYIEDDFLRRLEEESSPEDRLIGTVKIDEEVFEVLPQEIPGIAAASIYTANDAFGGLMEFKVPVKGTISNALFFDYDFEALQKDLILYREKITATADHDQYAVTDLDMSKAIGVISFTAFHNLVLSYLGVATPALSYVAPKGVIYGQFITRGTDTIAAGANPAVSMVIV